MVSTYVDIFFYEDYFNAVVAIIDAYMLNNHKTKNENVSQAVEKLSIDEKDYHKSS